MIRRLAILGAPVRLKDMDITPSHTRYHLLPDKVGSNGSQQPVTRQDIHQALRQILPDFNAQVAQLVQLDANDPTLTLMLRTPGNSPLSLREMLQHKGFVRSDPYTSIPLGLDITREAIVPDLADIHHLLIVGASAARLHLQLAVALTLSLFNSPAYLRLAFVGDPGSQFRHFIGSPHTLGNIVTNATGLRRLAEGLVKHASQRRKLFEEHGAVSLEAYNKLAISNKDLKPLPRIVVLLDSVAIPNWRSSIDEWQVPLYQLMNQGAAAGIHVVMACAGLSRESLPERIGNAFTHRVVMRSMLVKLGARFRLPPHIPLEFVDAILLDGAQDGSPLTLELAAVGEAEIIRAVNCWGEIRNKRNFDRESKGEPATTGNTGLLNLRTDIQPGATTMLRSPNGDHPELPELVVASASALAAYLGWLGMGPLRDVLQVSTEEADEILRRLLASGVLEAGDGPVWRFARLAEVPTQADKFTL
jgi:hypothetical protein